MKAEQPRPSSADPDTRRGVAGAMKIAFLHDDAADAEMARLIDRLRGEPGSNNGGKQ